MTRVDRSEQKKKTQARKRTPDASMNLVGYALFLVFLVQWGVICYVGYER
jgi:hypothetical protein